MSELQSLLNRQAQWQKTRKTLSWPEKVRMAARARESIQQLKQSYYCQLTNETDQVTVLSQVATKPPKAPKISRYSYRGAAGVDPSTLEGE